GLAFDLALAHPPDESDGAVVRYGASTAVPSRLAEPADREASVVLLATDWPADLARALTGLRATAPAATHLVVVADGPGPNQEAALPALPADAEREVIWTAARLGPGAALAAGLRRCRGSVVILLDPSLEPVGDVVGPLRAALADPAVGVAGWPGLVSGDLRRFAEAPAGEVDAIAGCLAFRRADAAARGPLDERFHTRRSLQIWWSLVLRDEGPERAPRRALAIDLPVVRHEPRPWSAAAEAEQERLERRDVYRLIDRFGKRRDLLLAPDPSPPRRER
ncbi:MAG: glycosyltransferase family 2 protein, partial [Candidatus Limnocylindrales bacterium]